MKTAKKNNIAKQTQQELKTRVRKTLNRELNVKEFNLVIGGNGSAAGCVPCLGRVDKP